MADPNTTSRLQALRIDIDPDVAQRHMAAVLREVRGDPPVVSTVPVRAPLRSRRRLVAALAATFVLLIPAAAFAAEDTVPGDLLYPVKQSTEWARSLVDPGVAQRHRVEELETVVDRGSPIAVVTDRFDASVDAVDQQEAALIQRVQQARERIRERYGVDLGPATSDPRDGDSGRGDLGNGETSHSGSEFRSSDGVADRSSSTTTPVAEIETNRSGPGSDADSRTDVTTTSSTTRSATGQPEIAPTPGSGGDRP